MNAFSVDYLSSNFNHVYSLVKENLSTTSNYLSAFVKENLSPILNDQQQRIALIAAGVFASLIASYALYRCCCRRKQIVPVKAAQVVSNTPQDSNINSSDVAASSTHADKKGKKKKRKAVVKKEVVTTVATVAANQLGVSGGKALDNQVNPGNTASDTAPAIDNGPAVAAPTNVDEDSKEEKVSSPIRRPKSENRTTFQVSTQTTPSISRSFNNYQEREFEKNGASLVRRGTLRTIHANGTSSAVFDVDTIEGTHPEYGSFKGKLKDGVYEGTRVWNNGIVQTGKFELLETGEYQLNDPNGSLVYRDNQHKRVITDKGHFVKGKLSQGERIITALADGSILVRCEGTFKDNYLSGSDGYNYKILIDQGIFEGHFANHKLNGQGRKTLLNGEVFKGNFIDDKLTDPKGKKILANGDIIEGNFVEDQLKGKGKKTLVNGDILEGNFVEDQLKGKGKKTLVNGDILEGDFVRDQLNNKGKKTLVNGDILEGMFVNGKLNGLVTITRTVDGGEIVEEKLYQNDQPKESGPIAVSFSSSGPRKEENKQGVQPPVDPKAEPVLRTFGAPAKTSSTAVPAKGAITFSSGTLTSTTSSTTTSSTTAPAKGPLRFPSLRSVTAPGNVNTQEQ